MARTNKPAKSGKLAEVGKLLLKRRDALRAALAGDLSSLRELSSGDEVDWALDSAQDEISSQLAEVESRELGHIENALERIETGQYGICEACEKKIPSVRLEALPYATLCLACQRETDEEQQYNNHRETQWGRDRDDLHQDTSDASLSFDEAMEEV
jgi:DnaK suppressor protein